MSFKRELESARTARILDRLLWRMRSEASPNWTLDSARRYVPSKLWHVLDEHFDEEGRIRAVQDAPGRTHADLQDEADDTHSSDARPENDTETGADGANPNGEANESNRSRGIELLDHPLEEAVWVASREGGGRATESEDQSRPAAPAASVSELIDSVHGRLREARDVRRQPTDDVRSPTPPTADPDVEPTAPESTSDGLPTVESPAPEGRTICPVCEEEVAKLVSWRSGELCEQCVQLLRGH